LSIAIRRFHHDDPPLLFDIFQQAVRLSAAFDYSPTQINAWAEVDRAAWIEHLRRLAPWVAEIDGVIAGYADLQPDGYIDHFFVTARFGRRGVGSLLMQALEQQARGQGFPLLYANVSLTARPFFAHHGFTLLAQQTISLRGADLINFRMNKALKS